MAVESVYRVEICIVTADVRWDSTDVPSAIAPTKKNMLRMAVRVLESRVHCVQLPYHRWSVRCRTQRRGVVFRIGQCRYRRSTVGAADLCRCCKNCRWKSGTRTIGNTHGVLGGRNRCTQTELCGALPFDHPTAPDISLLFNSEEQKDVDIVVGTGQQATRFPGHAMVLRSSPRLEDLILNGRDVKPGEDGSVLREIHIPNAQADVFQKVLQHLYTQVVHLESTPVALQVLCAAHDYVIHGLFIKCLNYIIENVSEENVLEVMIQLAQISGKIDMQENVLNELKDRCSDILDMHAEKILSSEGFVHVPYEIMTHIISRSSLWIKSEVSVFQAVDRWTIETCKRKGIDTDPESKQNVLGTAAFSIRYFQMSKQEFLDGPVAAAFLVQQDVTAILDHMNKKIKTENLPRHLQDILRLPRRQLPAARPGTADNSLGLSGAASSESISASVHTQVKQQKSTSRRFIKGAGEFFWNVISILD